MPSPAAPMPTLHTHRLTLQPARLEDAPHFQQAFDHWEVVRGPQQEQLREITREEWLVKNGL